MSEPDGKLLLEFLRARLSRTIPKDLDEEKDENLALRKALLKLIIMMQDALRRNSLNSSSRIFGPWRITFPRRTPELWQQTKHYATQTFGSELPSSIGWNRRLFVV
jgi:hypothetical protein